MKRVLAVALAGFLLAASPASGQQTSGEDDADALELWNNEDEAKCLANAHRHWESRTTV